MPDVYTYSYVWDIRYCYENSNVLRNKLGITDADALHAAEREIAAVRVLEAERTPIRGKFDFRHLCSIHRALFHDIYAWAGELRTVNISKGNPFCNYDVLGVYGEKVFGELKAERYLLDTPFEEVSGRLAHYLSEINVMHPFREGNGRVQRLFIEYLALVAGYRVNFSGVTAAEMIEASIRAFERDEKLMQEIFAHVTTPITREERQAAIRAITGERSEIMRIYKSIVEDTIKRRD